MSNRDIGIRALIPGQRSPDEIQEDENNKRYVAFVCLNVISLKLLI